MAQLEGKIQHCCDPVGVGPLIAFGGVDGVIRIWDVSNWTLFHRYCTQGGHKSVQNLLCYIVREYSIFLLALIKF